MSNINFHQTFPPTLEYISRIIEITDMNDDLTKEEISIITGIPTGKRSGKVEPHIDYAIYMGVVKNISEIKNKYRLVSTELGEIIKNEDIGLNEEISQLLCHIRLTSPSTGAPLWSTIIREILPNYRNGIKPVLLEDEIIKYNLSTSNNIKMGPFFSTYSKCFLAFDLISKDKNLYIIVPQTYKKELIYVYAYAILYEWEQIFPNSIEITSIEFNKLKFSSAFAFADSISNNVLELIGEMGLIKINGQLSPFTIIKMCESKDVLLKVFSLLC